MIALDRRVLVWLGTATLAACSDHASQALLEPSPLPPPVFNHGSAITELTFTSNAFEGARPALEAVFTPAIHDLEGSAMTGEVVFDGTGCGEVGRFPLRGKIVLVERGVCTFALKVELAQHAGAIGVIVHNSPDAPDPEAVITMNGDPNIPKPAEIPAIFVALSTGMLLRNGTPPVTASAVAALGPNTFPGSDVTVQPVDPTTGTSPVTLTFDEVVSGGHTTVITSGTGAPPTQGFVLGSPPVYYEIATTAGYTPPITVCVDYTGVQFGNEIELKLMHDDGSGWVDVTLPGYPDIENDLICGEVSSLSLFIVAEENVGCAHVTQIAQGECEALVALYSSTDGANWTNNTNWLQTNAPCSWYGVNCVGGALTELLLGGNQLSGTIPGELGNLRSLRLLHLFDNRLGGAMPAALGNLTNLTELIANHNQLTGAIPVELGDLVTLRSLFLNSNQLSGAIPAALGDLATLEVLALNENQLAGPIPATLGKLGKLQALRLQLNQLSGLVPLTVAQLGGRLGPVGCSFRPVNDALYVPDTPGYRAADLDHHGFICGVGFTADVGVVAADITEKVNALFNAGVINSGQRNGLSRKVNQALTLSANGKYVEAMDVLRGFIQQVNDLVTLDGVLTAVEAQPLIEATDVMIALTEAEMKA